MLTRLDMNITSNQHNHRTTKANNKQQEHAHTLFKNKNKVVCTILIYKYI